MNLLEETRDKLAEYGLGEEAVRWVGSSDGDYRCSWERFTKISDFNYKAGFGTQYIAEDLVVVGDTYWLERDEYDGAEGWALKRMPTLSPNPRLLAIVGIGSGNSLAELHEEQED